MTEPLIHVAAYRFVALPDADRWRTRILQVAADAGLRGTVLLAGEGINLALAGTLKSVDATLDWLQAEPRFSHLAVQRSTCATLPYRRLHVRVKPEIIRMNRSEIRPQDARAPAVAPRDLVRWMAAGSDDLGRELLLLDTRNAFEVAQGRFHGARHWSLGRFSDFPAAAMAHHKELSGKTVITYCTGGIRCEKAALFLANAGIPDVVQLDGGILNYFRTAGGVGYDGDCAVFDDRLAVAPTR